MILQVTVTFKVDIGQWRTHSLDESRHGRGICDCGSHCRRAQLPVSSVTVEQDPRKPCPTKNVKSKVFSTEDYQNPGPIIKPTPPYLQDVCDPVLDDECEAPAETGLPIFTTLTGVTVAPDIQNIDTDMIIPKDFLKPFNEVAWDSRRLCRTQVRQSGRSGHYGRGRGQAQNVIHAESGRIQQRGHQDFLIAGDNFGCGSSREHAPWSIMDMGMGVGIQTSEYVSDPRLHWSSQD
jgi:3-isopropylmalate dehydratase